MQLDVRSITCREAERLARSAAQRLAIVLGRLSEQVAAVSIDIERFATPGRPAGVAAHANIACSGGRTLRLRVAGADPQRAIHDLFGRIAGIACAGRTGSPRHRAQEDAADPP